MANSENIVVGAAAVSLAPWVTANGAGTYVAMGHTEGPAIIVPTFEDMDIGSEQQLIDIDSVPIKVGFEIRFTLKEVLIENYRIALRQLAAQKSGTPPNLTLQVVDPQQAYWQVKLVTKPIRSALSALGPNPGYRTIIGWRCIVRGLEQIQFGRSVVQQLAVSCKVLGDQSSTKGHFEIADTSVG